MPFLRYKPKNMGDVQLCLHGINGDVAVQFAEGATLPGVRTVAERRNPALGEAQGFTYRRGSFGPGRSPSYCRFVLITWIMPPQSFSSGYLNK